MRMNILVGGFTFPCPASFCCRAFVSRDLTLPSSRRFSLDLTSRNPCVMLHYVLIYTWTLTETFTMPLWFLYCGASPLLLLLLFYFSFCQMVCNSWWHEMLLYLLAEGAAVRSCCFVLWICWRCISPVMHNVSLILWYYWLWFCLTFPCNSSFFIFRWEVDYSDVTA